MGQPGWIPDWFGNNGRTVIQALFQGPNCVDNTVNYGCYDSSAVNTLITKAESATLTASGRTGPGEHDIMKDAAIVPFFSQTFPTIASKRVRRCCRTAPPTRRPCSRRPSANWTSRTSGWRADARSPTGSPGASVRSGGSQPGPAGPTPRYWEPEENPVTLLEVRDLNVSFPTADGVVRAVRGVSFEVEPGQTLGVVGESGSGKTVLTQTLLGLTPGAEVSGRPCSRAPTCLSSATTRCATSAVSGSR